MHQRELVESIVTLLPAEKAAFPINFLCCLLHRAIFLGTTNSCKNELEKRISAILEHVTVDDLLVLSFTYDGERLFDLESVRRIISGFMEKEKSVAMFKVGDFGDVCTTAMQRVAKTVDVYLGEIATYGDLSISKFNGIAILVPKGARKADDDLYRAVDIYLKVCSEEGTRKMPLELARVLSIEREPVTDPEIRVQSLEAIYLLMLQEGGRRAFWSVNGPQILQVGYADEDDPKAMEAYERAGCLLIQESGLDEESTETSS